MKDNQNFYEVHSWGSDLKHGVELSLKNMLYFRPERADLTPFVDVGLAELVKLRETSIAAEESIFNDLKKAMSKWERQGAVTMIIERAIKYLETPEPSHTSNQWQKTSTYDERHEISNRVYKMYVSIYENTEYNRQTGKSEPVSWQVTWGLSTNAPGSRSTRIAGQHQKRFTDKAAAIKYIEGRKKAHAHLFTEISPPIPQKYAEEFKINGLLLPGYTVENQEPQLTKHTTIAEILKSMGVDIAMSTDQKSSVLEKLSEAKQDAKELEKNTLPKEKSHPKERKDI